jgi:hypothetical protein
MHDIHDDHDAAEATCYAAECLKPIKPQDDAVEVQGGLVHLACYWDDDERDRPW